MLVTMFGKCGPAYPHEVAARPVSQTGPRGVDLARRGYHVVYRENEVNRCPGCGRSHWYVGRLSAECGFCGTALMLADVGTHGVGLVRRGQQAIGRSLEDFADAA